jgi:peptidoglycan hydrolase-like protein with peptidoglycan-binding domain
MAQAHAASEATQEPPPLAVAPVPQAPTAEPIHAQVLVLQRLAGNKAVGRLHANRMAWRALQRCGTHCSCRSCQEEQLPDQEADARGRLLQAAAARALAAAVAARQARQPDWVSLAGEPPSRSSTASAYGGVLVHERLLQRSVEEEGSPGNRPNLDAGDSGPGVTLLQRLLGIRETGTFDQPTRRGVIAYQKARHWLHPATGGVGPKTWESLDSGRDATSSDQPEGTPGARPSLDLGDQGPGVKLLQRYLGIAETGTFDEDTRKAVIAFQERELGTGQGSGGVGPMTWKALEERARKPPTEGTLVVGGKVVGKVTNFRLVTGVQATPRPGAGGTIARRVLARAAAEAIEVIAEGADAVVEGAPVSGVRVIVARGFLAGVPAAAAAGVCAAGFLIGLGGGALVGFVIMHAQEVEGVPKRPYEEYPGNLLPGGAPPQAATPPTSPQPQPAPTPQPAPQPAPRRYPNQTCDDAVLDALHQKMKDVCDSGWSCSDDAERDLLAKQQGMPKGKRPTRKELDKARKAGQGFTVDELARRAQTGKECKRLRELIQRDCFGGQSDPGHAQQIADIMKAIEECEEKELATWGP